MKFNLVYFGLLLPVYSFLYLDRIKSQDNLAAQNYLSESVTEQVNQLYLNGKKDSLLYVCLQETKLKPSIDNLYLLGAAYWFNGDTARSKEIIEQVVDSLYLNQQADTRTPGVWLFDPGSNRLMNFFLAETRNRYNVFDIIRRKCTAKVNKPESSRSINELIMNDQYFRYLFYSKIGFIEPYTERIVNDSIQSLRNRVFDFYKDKGQFFSREDVGMAYEWQFLLLAHEDNIDRRTYYFKLLKKAVKTGICTKDRLVDFLLRTDAFRLKPEEFKKVKAKRIEELKKIYMLETYEYKIY